MSFVIHPVNDASDIETVATLADEIWRQHFTPIIGKAQVDYMLEQFQSAPAITQQTESGFEYYLAAMDSRYTGYIGLVPDHSSGRLMISKFYVLQAVRGSGLGTRLLKFVVDHCRQNNLDTIWLTVNRHNDIAINWYLGKGFVIVDEVKKDIGEGFYMDDYIMELKP